MNKTITKKPIDAVKRDNLVRNLMCAVLLQAVKDYVGETAECNKSNLPAYYFDKDTIIRDLKSDRMMTLTDGMSSTVAYALQTNADNIKDNLSKLVEEFEAAKVETYGEQTFN